MLLRNYVRKPLDLQQRYGKGTWAIVTGATGGIGEAYCIELANRNFNLILFGRNKENVDQLKKKIKKINPNVETIQIVTDLGVSLSPEYYEGLYNQYKDLDISILINNAGWCTNSHFIDKALSEHLSEFRVTAGAPAMLTSFLINKLLSRNKKSAIINVSSLSNYIPCPYIGTYPASKRFMSLFSYYLNDNYGDKIDIQDLCPLFVSTKINNFRKGDDVISPQKCVESSLRDLGQEMNTVPVPGHSFGAQFMHIIYRHAKPIYKMLVVAEMEKESLRIFCNEAKKN
mmetsp:Transcript_13793/g.12225  ORF Transcript_13793/g.12225 Transcript_13793/m.12225 type:complete len:286 (+) Transcript_13793:104-961(+)